MRQLQKIAEQANVGPGSTEYLKPMGAENPRRVPFGNKYKFKADSNPAPGQYDPSKGYNIVK